LRSINLNIWKSLENIFRRNWIWSKRGLKKLPVDRNAESIGLFRTAVVESKEKGCSRNYIIQALVNVSHDASHIFEQCIQQKQYTVNCKKKWRYLLSFDVIPRRLRIFTNKILSSVTLEPLSKLRESFLESEQYTNIDAVYESLSRFTKRLNEIKLTDDLVTCQLKWKIAQWASSASQSCKSHLRTACWDRHGSAALLRDTCLISHCAPVSLMRASIVWLLRGLRH